jgi:hypothetical protein
MFNRKFMALVLGGCVGVAANAAGDSHQGYVGALIGGQTLQTTGTGGTSTTQFALGATAGALLFDGVLGVGADFTWGTKNSQSTTFYNLDANYYWKDVAPGLYTGIKFGFQHNVVNTPFDFGFAIGYDYAVMSNLSIGAEVAYIRVLSKDIMPAQNTYNYLATAKWWF